MGWGARPETRYVRDADGAYIGYQMSGRGPLVILLAFGHNVSIEDQADGHDARSFIDALGEIGRVVRFDRRGMGVSDRAPSSTGDSWEVWSDDARVLLDALRVPRAVVIATDSTATNSSLLFAATHPDRVSRLVLFHPAVRYVEADDYPCGMTVEEADRIVNVAWKSLVTPDVRFIDPMPGESHEGFYDWWIRARRRTPPAEMRRFVTSGIRSDLRSVLPAIHVPTLVFSRPPPLPLDSGLAARARYVADHLPDAKLIELASPGTGLVYLGEHHEVIAEIASFTTGASAAVPSSRFLTTVLFTDIVGSTRQLSEVGDQRWRQQLDTHDTLTRQLLTAHGGRLVNTTGDGFVATFDGPARGIACAVAIHDATETMGIAVRSGIHTGEVERRGNDIAGITVHIASRVAAIAAAGEVLVTRTVVDLVAGAGLTFAPRGSHTLRDVEGTWDLHTVST